MCVCVFNIFLFLQVDVQASPDAALHAALLITL